MRLVHSRSKHVSIQKMHEILMETMYELSSSIQPIFPQHYFIFNVDYNRQSLKTLLAEHQKRLYPVDKHFGNLNIPRGFLLAFCTEWNAPRTCFFVLPLLDTGTLRDCVN